MFALDVIEDFQQWTEFIMKEVLSQSISQTIFKCYIDSSKNPNLTASRKNNHQNWDSQFLKENLPNHNPPLPRTWNHPRHLTFRRLLSITNVSTNFHTTLLIATVISNSTKSYFEIAYAQTPLTLYYRHRLQHSIYIT